MTNNSFTPRISAVHDQAAPEGNHDSVLSRVVAAQEGGSTSGGLHAVASTLVD
eukprot:COSAG02_NODE_3892_length_6074_cov_5.045690_8_plen_53_part_00